MNPLSVPKYEARQADAGKNCSTCQTHILIGELVTKCPACGIVYHASCWVENEGCAQYGCRFAPETDKNSGPLQQSNVWAANKVCPKCGQTIKATALKCRYCGADFDTRDFVSKDDFAARPYRDKEYAYARAMLIALFLASVSGCLSPIALLLQILLRYSGLGDRLEYRRLPDELKALNLLGLIASAVLVSLGALAMILHAARGG